MSKFPLPRPTTMRRNRIAAAVITLAVIATAVGSLAGNSSASDSAKTAGVTNLLWVTDDEGAPQLEALKIFNKTHPKIHVKAQILPFSQLLTELPTRLGAHDATIDIVLADAPLVANYGVHGWLAPLDAYFPQSLRAKYVSAAVSAGVYKGRLYGIPREDSSQILLINRSLFTKAHVAPPTSLRAASVQSVMAKRWTWDHVASAAKTIKTRTGANGFVFEQVDAPYNLLPLGESLGGPALSKDGLTASGYLNSPAWVKAATWYYDTYNVSHISPPGVVYPQTPPLFFAGKVAMMVSGTWSMPQCKTAKFVCDVAAHPYFAGGRAVTPNGSLDLAIGAYSKHKPEAAEFIKWFTLYGNSHWTDLSGNLPATVAGISKIVKAPANARWPGNAQRLAATEAKTTAVARPSTPGYQEFQDSFSRAFASIRGGQQPAAALKAAASQIDGLLKRYRR